MLRIAKLTDYGIALMAHIAALPTGDVAPGQHSARELAASAHIPLPTVSKLLKILSQSGLLTATRGARGGYVLSRPAAAMTLADVVKALEGPISLTECHAKDPCSREGSCHLQPHLHHLNSAIEQALAGLSLATLASDAERSARRANGGPDGAKRALALPILTRGFQL